MIRHAARNSYGHSKNGSIGRWLGAMRLHKLAIWKQHITWMGSSNGAMTGLVRYRNDTESRQR